MSIAVEARVAELEKRVADLERQLAISDPALANIVILRLEERLSELERTTARKSGPKPKDSASQ